MKRIALAMIAAIALAACGDSEPRELAGYRREPAPVVGDLELPDLADDGQPFALQAEPDGLLLIYFGYTNCPDFCPTTLSDARLAIRQLDEPSAVQVAMVTIDPERDAPILSEYVGGFFPETGHALATDDEGLLADVAAPFGTSWDITTSDDGEIEVSHRTDLYAVDDRGVLVLTWPFGVSKDDIAADIEQLLEAEA